MAKRQTKMLSDAQLRAWVDAGNPVAKSDGDGLTFTMSTHGTAAWTLRYRHGGRRKELTLGRYPDLGLKSARLRAAAERLAVQGGADVAVEKQRRKAVAVTAWTVRQLVVDVQAKVLPMLATGTQAMARSYITSDLLPRFGPWPARDVTPDDAQAWLEGIAEARGYQAAVNARKYAALVFKHGMKRRVVPANPFRAVAMDTVAEKPATKVRVKLSDAELRPFLRGLSDLGEFDALVARILLLLGVRAGELFGAEWVDLDLGTAIWKIPRSKIKTKKHMTAEHFIIPLPAEAVEWFRRLHELACGSRWVLAPLIRSEQDRKPRDYERVLDRLSAYTDKLGRRITFHDLRSTARSHWSSLGVRTEVAERMLNHSLGGLLQVYDQNDYLDERRAALVKWAATLRALESGDNVVPMRAATRTIQNQR